jgi:ABC-2 type transport system permease protein
LFFLVGFAWPREAIPDVVLRAGAIFPSGFAIDGLVRVNQMGARLHEVGRDWGGLWCLVALYLMLAFLSARARLKPVHG